jgi:hypothetical protein
MVFIDVSTESSAILQRLHKSRSERSKTLTVRYWPISVGASETLVDQIMRTIHIDRTEAMRMAIGMLVTQLIIAAEIATPAFGEPLGSEAFGAA